ncbi:MAG: hypothetical protein HY736_12735 [Verrucomicrobia bacterium]|nr:hypothetical protein [Verrucomicrobiota bacterium]
MSRLRTFTSLLLLTLWLPATLHCALEAGNPFDSAAACCTGEDAAVGDNHCAIDNCAVLESNLVRPVGDDLVVPAPVLLTCLCGLIEIAPETIIVPTVSPERTHCPPELARTWQFVERAAPSPRAP